jgi:hypothetical protein
MPVAVHAPASIQVEVFEGDKTTKKYYLVDSEEEKNQVEDAQWSVKWRIWLFELLWYAAWLGYAAPIAFALSGLGWQLPVTLVCLAIALLAGFAVFQTRFYARLDTGGISAETEGRLSYLGYYLMAIGILIGIVAAGNDPNLGLISGIVIWVVSGFIIVMMQCGPDRKKKKEPAPPTTKKGKKGEKEENEPEPAPQEPKQQIAVRSINGQIKEVAGKMDVDLVSKPVFSSTAEQEEMVLTANIIYRWPRNPVHLVKAFELPGINAARDALDGAVNKAGMWEIRQNNYQALKAEDYHFYNALYALFGRYLTDDEVLSLKNISDVTWVHSPFGLDIISVTFTVQGTEKQRAIWALNSEAQGRRSASLSNADTLFRVIRQLKEEARRITVGAPGTPGIPAIDLSDAEAKDMAQRILGYITTQQINLTGSAGVESIAGLIARELAARRSATP